MILALASDRSFEAMTGDGGDILFLASEDQLQAALQEGTPEFILLDVGLSTLDGPSLVLELKQNPATRRIPLVVFGNSLRADLLQDAQEAGADLVLPKAAFRDQWPSILRRYGLPDRGRP